MTPPPPPPLPPLTPLLPTPSPCAVADDVHVPSTDLEYEHDMPVKPSGVHAADGGDVDERARVREHPTPRLSRTLVLACSGMIALTAAWGFWPQSRVEPTEPQPHLTATLVASIAQSRPLDLAAFQAPLWVAPIPPPAPPAPPPPAPPPPPLKLQLIAITTGEEAGGGTAANTFTALIYDPDQGKLFTLSAGQVITGRTIVRITESLVELREESAGRADGLVRTLSLKSEASKPPTQSERTVARESSAANAAAGSSAGEGTP